MDSEENSEGFGTVEERESEESAEETSENVGVTESEEKTEEVESEAEKPKEEAEKVETKGSEEPELTEKGTKLDSNPQSALHQQLANEKRARSQVEQVLGDPKLLAKFAEQQYGIKIPVEQETAKQDVPTKQYTAEDFQNIEDVATKFNELQKSFDEKSRSYEEQIKELKTVADRLVDGSRDTQITSAMEKDVVSLKSVPELKRGDPDFVEGLEAKIVERYYQQDFDEQTGKFRGNTSLKRVADDIIEAIKLGRQAGAQKAQTIVKDKTEGRVRTSAPAKTEQSTDNMSAGGSIAAGIKRLGLR